MTRKPNTDRNGDEWPYETKLAAWMKGETITDLPPGTWKKDKCGAKMKFSEHGNRNSEFGWEIDHINPVSNGGTDSIHNLQPLN